MPQRSRRRSRRGRRNVVASPATYRRSPRWRLLLRIGSDALCSNAACLLCTASPNLQAFRSRGLSTNNMNALSNSKRLQRLAALSYRCESKLRRWLVSYAARPKRVFSAHAGHRHATQGIIGRTTLVAMHISDESYYSLCTSLYNRDTRLLQVQVPLPDRCLRSRP